MPDPERIDRLLRGAPAWIAGGRGFIGRRLVCLLRERGARVHIFGGDVRDAAAAAESLEATRPSFVYNLAAPVDPSRDPALREEMESTITGGARAVADAVERLGGRPLVVQVGTCEEYGTIPAPFAEDDEPSPPVSPYAAAKLEATREILRRAREGTLRAVVARPFLTYGPGQGGDRLVPAAIRAALAGRPFEMTSGIQTREFNYVDDTARGLLAIAATPELEGRIVNVAGGEERMVLDVVRLVFDLAGAPRSLIRAGALPHRQGEVPSFFADTTRCREVLGHVPQVSLEDGLRLTIEACRT